MTNKEMLTVIANDVAVIKHQIVNLRIRVAAVSATVAVVVGLVLNGFSHPSSSTTQRPVDSHERAQSSIGPDISTGSSSEAGSSNVPTKRVGEER